MKKLLLSFAVIATMGLASCGEEKKETEEIKKENKAKVIETKSTVEKETKKTTECDGYGDERFIKSKMDQMDRDVLEFSTIGKRKYYVRYISWSTGNAIEGDQTLDYSNNPCND